MFEQCSSRTYVRGKLFLAEVRKLDYRSHFEHLSDEIYETVERANLQMDLALEFPGIECPDLCNCRTAEKMTSPDASVLSRLPPLPATIAAR